MGWRCDVTKIHWRCISYKYERERALESVPFGSSNDEELDMNKNVDHLSFFSFFSLILPKLNPLPFVSYKWCRDQDYVFWVTLKGRGSYSLDHDCLAIVPVCLSASVYRSPPTIACNGRSKEGLRVGSENTLGPDSTRSGTTFSSMEPGQ